MRKVKLDKSERAIERAVVRGEYRPGNKDEFERIAQSIVRRRKDAVLNIRINSEDLTHIKAKAKKLGVPYQTFISEILHRFAA